MLRQYIPCVREFLRILTECRALIGGVFALGFLLRDPEIDPGFMDIYVNDLWFQVLVEYLVYSPILSPTLTFKGVTISGASLRERRDIRRTASFSNPHGLSINVHESSTVSACSPISRAYTSALMNYITDHSFACAYPRLTFARKGLVSDLNLDIVTDEEFCALASLLRSGWVFASDLSQWPNLRLGNPSPTLPGTYPCARSVFACPDQGRYFGDLGSLVAFIDPMADDYRAAFRRGLPPYGHMVAWRMWGSSMCMDGCAVNDTVLPPGIVSIPMMLVDDPLFRSSGAPRRDPSHPPRTLLTTMPGPIRVRGRAQSV
ncbi:hypothetical protein C8Q76DRAFT_797907 [Earliella scabrosa]|nr:hypothetical protein C8Q76DRAFT_797907 [Earliella scabrosa]